jgi:hypothetical protein
LFFTKKQTAKLSSAIYQSAKTYVSALTDLTQSKDNANKKIQESISIEQLYAYLCRMERQFYKTPAYEKFLNSLDTRAQKKVKYVIEYIRKERNLSSKFVKHLVNTNFYEMRISVDNEYRVILFAIDNDNIINANVILLLNGFIKKSTVDYDKQIAIAQKIMEDIL